MSNLRKTVNSASAQRSSAAGAIQSAFRDITSHYLNANKENIPPAGATFRGLGGSGKGSPNCCGTIPLPPPSIGGSSSSSKSSTTGEAERTCCGTPVQVELTVDAQTESQRDEVAAAQARSPSASRTRTSADNTTSTASTDAAGLTEMTPNTRAPRGSAFAVCVATPGAITSVYDNNGLPNVARTPGHNSSPAVTATKLMQQRHRSLSAAHSILLGSPLCAQGKSTGHSASPWVDGAVTNGGGGGAAPASQQSSLNCTPSGARRSAAAAAAAAARAVSETPTRIEDISFYLNNSFESGSESPMLDGAGGYGVVRTPHRTFDLQQAVEDMLRGCLDSSTPTKNSDASSISPHGSRKRQQHQLDTAIPTSVPQGAAPFSGYAALNSLFAAPAPSKSVDAAASAWGESYAITADHPPECFVTSQGVFAESDEEDGGTSPYSEEVSRGAPAAGVRRDPMVYFSTSAYAEVSSPSCEAMPPRSAAAEEAVLLNCDGRGDDMFHSLPLSVVAPAGRNTAGSIAFHSDGSTSGPDMLAMLAAAVQQQQQPRQQQQQSPRSRDGGSADVASQTFSDREKEAGHRLPPPPPSYDDGHPPSRFTRRDATASAGPAGATHPLPPPRRSHHLPQVKAAAGSLIAVSGRRVPVDKLHLLSLSSGDESAASANSSPTAAAASTASGVGARHTSSIRGGPTARTQASSPPAQQHHHVERPSMRRVPKANVVTVTRAAGSIGSAVRRPGGLQSVTAIAAALPSSSSHAGLIDATATRVFAAAGAGATTATTRVVVSGPSARRIPPTAHSTNAQQARQASGAACIDGSGVRQSSESDVVAVLQFSKGQTMRFQTNLSAAALETAQAALARDMEVSRGRSDGSAAAASAAAHVRLTHTPLSTVEVGKSYLAHIYGDQSPYDRVAYEDVGVCVRLYTAASATPEDQACREHINGVLLREVDIFAYEEDRQQHEQVLQQQTAAYIECERQFKFSSLPFQLESIYFTFDGRICVVLYRVVAADATTSATMHRFSNTSRVVRELQFHLNSRVFLKQC